MATLKFIDAPLDNDIHPTNFLYDNTVNVVIDKETDKKKLINIFMFVCILLFVTLGINTIILLLSEDHTHHDIRTQNQNK